MPGSLGHEEQDAKTFASWVYNTASFLNLIIPFAHSNISVAIKQTVIIIIVLSFLGWNKAY